MRNGFSVLKEAKGKFRSAASLTLIDHAPAGVQSMGREELLHLQFLLGHGNQWGVWQTPREWFPGGTTTTWEARVEGRLNDVVLQRLQPGCLRKQGAQLVFQRLVDAALLSCIRYLVLCRYAPVSLRNGRHPLDPTSLATLANQHLPVLAATSIVKAMGQFAIGELEAENGDVCFKRLVLADVESMSQSQRVMDALTAEIQRMHRLSTRGWWSDAPEVGVDIRRVTQVRGDATKSLPQRSIDPHKPLPDGYVGEMGQKSHWLITHLGPGIVQVLSSFQQIWKQAALERYRRGQISARCAAFLKEFKWKDAQGLEIEVLPFYLRLSQHGLKINHLKNNPLEDGYGEEPAVERGDKVPISSISTSWPPNNLAQIFGLANALQGAHLFVAGLSMGARRSEALVMERSCVTQAPDGTTFGNGRTFKLVQRHDGVPRDWPLPDLAEQAIIQQARLASLLERLSLVTSDGVVDPDTVPVGTNLWCRRGSVDRTNQVSGNHIGYVLRKYAEALGLEPNPGGQPLRPHRLRKTLARMAALAIVQAPKVLQDVFGHKSIEMTLYYILADKSLSAEIDTIIRELRVVRAEMVVADMVSAEEAASTGARVRGRSDVGHLAHGGYGGLAAVTVQHAVQTEGRELHRRALDWEADSIRDLAEVLTMNGTLWNLVRPGVICTKSMGQAGPCNKKRGHPDPTQCQASCNHRLEEAWLREDVDQCIKEALDLWQRETSAGQDLVAEHWAGQIRAHVGRFPDLHSKWMQDARVRDLVTPAHASESAQ